MEFCIGGVNVMPACMYASFLDLELRTSHAPGMSY